MAEEFDYSDLFVDDGFVLDFDDPIFSDSPAAEDFSGSSPDSMNSWIGEIESMLMNDDDDRGHQGCLGSDQNLVSDFLADILVDSPDGVFGFVDSSAVEVSDVPVVDSPTDGSGSGEFVVDKESDVADDSGNECSDKETADASTQKNSLSSNDLGKESSEKERPVGPDVRNVDEDDDEPDVRNDDEDEGEGEDDSVAKKKRRQLRNRDAAVRSRERKKIYVKDLETKSKYLERECVRLGRMLQCFVAENQNLRLYLRNGGKAYDAPIAKQESAVLLLESLLLGSLLWHLWGIIICQFPQPRLGSQLLPQATEVGASGPENVAPKGRGNSSSLSTLPYGKCRVKSRRCKASRPRMKPPGSSTGVTLSA